MISYRFRRRAFLGALGGGLGLKIILRNLEASAQGMKSPGRLLVTHWPVGVVAGSSDSLWKPTAGSVGGSLGLKPFADAGLGADMTVFRGLSTAHLITTGNNSHKAGLVAVTTGRVPPANRASCCEGDDAVAAPGGSFDQVLLETAPALRRPLGYASSIADSRTDVGELSTQCLSYSTTSEKVTTYVGAEADQSKPLLPVLSPLAQYNNLFSSFVPGSGGASGAAGAGGGNGPVADAMLKRMVRRKSVLDFALEELDQMRAMAPAAAKNKLRVHSDAILGAEQSLVNAINAAYPKAGAGSGGSGPATPAACGASCSIKPAAPPLTVTGMADPSSRGTGNFYGRASSGTQDDAPMHQAAGKAHLDILKAAFVCDLIRVGTFQWSPAMNHVSFALFPGQTAFWRHHPTSHNIGGVETVAASTPDTLNPNARFLFNVQLWYFARMAENLVAWKSAVDGCGNPLLDSTIVPFLTEVRTCGHERTNLPGMLIGGKALGFTHGTYRTDALPINDYWASVGQALGHPGGGAFGTPVPGIWTKPA